MMTVGFDFGSVYTKAVLLGADGSLLFSVYRRKEAGDLQTVAEFLAMIERRCPGERMRAAVTGADPGSAYRGTLLAVSNIIAVAAGVQRMELRARTIVEIGGHTSKFIVCDANDAGGRIREFATNDAYAAAFLEQQVRRLDLTVEDLSALSRTAARAAAIALQLFLDVTAKKEFNCCSTWVLLHLGQRTFFASCALTLMETANFLRHFLQRYSYVGI